MTFIISLSKYLNVSINDILSSNFGDNVNESVTEKIDNVDSLTYNRFLGTYSAYYFKTSSTNTKLMISQEEYIFGFDYGVLHIYHSPDSNELNSKSSYKIFAVFNLSLEKMKEVKEFLEKEKDFSGIENLLLKNDKKVRIDKHPNIYSGNISVSIQHVFLNLTNNGSGEKVLMILHLPPTNAKYLGGIGAVSSVSRGRIKDPCIQNIAISREIINGIGEAISGKQPTAEEIELSKFLKLTDYGKVIQKSEIKEIVDDIEKIYSDDTSNYSKLTSKMKSRIIEAEIRDLIEKYLCINSLMLSKVTDDDDHGFYRLIKRSIK